MIITCLFKGGGMEPPKAPKPPISPDAAQAVAKGPIQKKRGFLSTILTGGSGDTSSANLNIKTLLGA